MTKAERTRQFIIEQSAPIFNTKGVAGTAMSDIMEATKLAKGSLYVHFDSKEDLAYAAADYNLDKLAQKVSAALAKHKTGKAKLFAYIDFLSDPINPPVIGGCPMMNYGMEADDTDAVLKQKVDKFIQAAAKRLVSITAQGIADGEFKSDWDANEFGIKVFAMLEGGILMSRVAGNKNQMNIIANALKKEIEEHSM